MAKIYFNDGSSVEAPSTEVEILKVINSTLGSSFCNNITKEIDDYDWEDEDCDLIAKHRAKCAIYQAFYGFGACADPIGLVAVEF